MPVATERRSKMDAPTAAAMWEDAGVYLHGQRVIHRYYINEFGHKFTVPEKEIKRLECDRVPPITGSSRVGDDDFFWWYKDPVEVITTKLKKFLPFRQLNYIGLKFNKLDIIIGGDHGQKAFRLSLKVILKRGERNEKVSEFVANIGEVECKKRNRRCSKEHDLFPDQRAIKENGELFNQCRGSNNQRWNPVFN